jgi:hypothetical protein
MDDHHFNYITKLKNKTLVKGVDVIKGMAMRVTTSVLKPKNNMTPPCDFPFFKKKSW